MTKQEAINSIEPLREYRGSEIRFIINSISHKAGKAPTKFKKGDLLMNVLSSKPRPCVVIKVVKDGAWCSSITSSDDNLRVPGMNIKSRFLPKSEGDFSYFSKELRFFDLHYLTKYYLGVLDDRKAVAEVTNYFKSIKL